MKKLISAGMLLWVLLCLTSCLRDVRPANTYYESPKESTTVVTEQMTDQSVSNVTESETPVVTPKPHAQVMKWSDMHPSPDAVIMTPKEIEEENKRIADASDAIFDIFSCGSALASDELFSLVNKHGIPAEQRYDTDGSPISAEHMETVKSRMSIPAADEYPVVRAVLTARGNLRAIPDNKPYRKSPDNLYDSIQQTELCVGTAVLVLYTSGDGEYSFVISHSYSGWISSRDIGIADDDEIWRSFASPESFVCITDALYTNGNAFLDMGCTLPLVAEESLTYTVKLPIRNSDGILSDKEIYIPRNSASVGYLPYTYENYLTQAFKYEGTDYGWGGLDNGIDCSGFVRNVFKCFGFSFPRDTKHQDKVVGKALSVTGMGHADIAAQLDFSAPAAVYYPGHTLLYIGHDIDNNLYYFIHAPQIGEKVCVTTKSDLTGMTYIGRVGPSTEA